MVEGWSGPILAERPRPVTATSMEAAMTKGTTPRNALYSTIASCCLSSPVHWGARWLRRSSRLIALLAPLLFCAGHATAQPQCNTRESIRTQLAERYGESPVATGVTSGGALVEVYSANNGRTWSIVVTDTNGISCLAAAGEGWRMIVAQMGQES